jgi:DNA-directed RNA polymerase specialized sigma24 family protein
MAVALERGKRLGDLFEPVLEAKVQGVTTVRSRPFGLEDGRMSTIHRALAQLRPQERRLIELTYWTTLSQREVAAELSLQPSEMQAHMRRALTQLAELVDCQEVSGVRAARRS